MILIDRHGDKIDNGDTFFYEVDDRVWLCQLDNNTIMCTDLDNHDEIKHFDVSMYDSKSAMKG